MNLDLNNELNFLLKNNPQIFNFIELGIPISKIQSSIDKELYINQETKDGIIATLEGVELYFSKEKKLYMWIIKSFDNNFYFSIKGKKNNINKVSLKKFIALLGKSKTEWFFNQEYCFLDQVCVTLNNQVSFLFGFNEKGTNSLDKIMSIRVDIKL